MGRARDAYTAVLRALREDIRLGRRPAGSLFRIDELAKQNRISTTPVREALAHLAGEGLVTDSPGSTRAVLPYVSGEAAELYALNSLLLTEVLRRRDQSSPEARKELVALWKRQTDVLEARAERQIDAISRLFMGIIASSRDRAIVGVFDRLDARLGLLRRAESLLLPQGDAEIGALARAYVEDVKATAGPCKLYHERRIAVAEALASTGSRPPNSAQIVET